jgi:hypothetical protein
MLARHGIEPAPKREQKTSWKEFLRQHWDLIVAADFFTIEAWTRRGLQRFLVLFLMELSSRKVGIAGMAPSPNGLWMNQIGAQPDGRGGRDSKGARVTKFMIVIRCSHRSSCRGSPIAGWPQ